MIQAKIVADSKNQFGNRVTTFVLTYPRIIHSEVMTHRMFSRNAASSRAVPAIKLIEAVKNNPFVPIAFQREHSGMQGTEYITDPSEIQFEVQDWLDDRDYAIKKAEGRLKRKVTKQLINRPLEPFQWYTSIVTATEYENFFALRCPRYEFEEKEGREAGAITKFRSRKDLMKFHKDIFLFGDTLHSELEWLKINKGAAEIHMMALAEAMWDAYNESTSNELKDGEWHIPFGDKLEEDQFLTLQDVDNKFPKDAMGFYNNAKIKIATARCARVSYTVVGEEGKPDNYDNDIKLHDRLAASGHWSPFEHCARAMEGYIPESIAEYPMSYTPVNEWSGNFRGFIQYRKTFEGENR